MAYYDEACMDVEFITMKTHVKPECTTYKTIHQNGSLEFIIVKTLST